MFPKIDAKRFNIHDDQKMVLDFLLQEKVLLVEGDSIQLAVAGSFPHRYAAAN